MATLAMQIQAGISKRTAEDYKRGMEQWLGLFHWHKLERQNQRASLVQARQEWDSLINSTQKDLYRQHLLAGDNFMIEAQAKQNLAEQRTAEGNELLAAGMTSYNSGAYNSAADTWELAASKYAEASLAYANGIEKCDSAFKSFKLALQSIVPPDQPAPPPP